MKIEHTLLRPGPCPTCGKEIIKNNKPNKYYAEIWVLFSDGSNANFAICKDCKISITPEQKENCHLKAIKWGHTKSAL